MDVWNLLKHSSTAVTRPFSSLEPKAVRKLSRETRPESHAVSKQQNNSQSLQDLKTPKLTYKTPTQKLKQQTNNCTTASGQQKSHAYGITFHRTTGSRHNWAFRSRARRGVRGETRAACARAQWHMQNGMPREEHLDKAQKSEEQLTQTRKGEELTLSCI